MDFHNAKISELEKTADNSDAKTFWQCLKSMDDTRKGEDVPSISEENLLQYFHNLHSNEPLNPRQQNICNEPRQNECHGQHSRPLAFMITEREIRKAAEKLKNNKSPFSDKIRNEMIKASIDTLMPVYEKLFNSILNQGTMPQTWCGGLITPIYKSGERSDPAKKIPVYLCLQLLGKTILFYLKSTTSRVYFFFEYTPQISNWLFTE